MAVRQALKIIHVKGFRKISLASDCLSLIQRILATSKDRSPVGTVVSDILRLASEFTTCTFRHVGRRLNAAARTLARSSEPSCFNIFVDVVPDSIRDIYFVMMFPDQ
jgi:hypothetical protein